MRNTLSSTQKYIQYKMSSSSSSSSPNDEGDISDCMVCRERTNNYIKLDCDHTFCYMCIKQILHSKTVAKKCPYCRGDIDSQLLEEAFGRITIERNSWAYSGRNDGWWAYDALTNRRISDAYIQGEDKVDITICGEPYTISFLTMEQIGKTTTRKIKQIKKKDKVKGVAGLRQKDD